MASSSITRSFPGKAADNSSERGQAAPVSLDRSNIRSGTEQRAGESAGARTNFVDILSRQFAGNGRYSIKQLLIEEKILS
jgi:hypothetical protein